MKRTIHRTMILPSLTSTLIMLVALAVTVLPSTSLYTPAALPIPIPGPTVCVRSYGGSENLYLGYVCTSPIPLPHPEVNVEAFDGSLWSIIPLPLPYPAPFSPDITVSGANNDTLTLVTMPERPGGPIWIRHYDFGGGIWTQLTAPSFTDRGVNPAVAYYAPGGLYLFWEDTSTTPSTIRCTGDEYGWADYVEFADGEQPATAVFNDELYLVYVRENAIIYRIYNGVSWSGENPRGVLPEPLPGPPSRLSLTVHNGLLHISYKCQPIYLNTFNGDVWSSAHILENFGGLSPDDPAVTSFNDTLHVFYASDGCIYYQTLQGDLGAGEWSTPTKTPKHDVAVTEVAPSKTVVGQGYSVKIDVTCRNLGSEAENFTVKLFTGTPPTTEQWSIFWSMGDVNLDGAIGNPDLDIIFAAFGSLPGDPTWNPYADITQDGIVDSDDLSSCMFNQGKNIWAHFASGSLIGNSTVSIDPDLSDSFPFTWDTTGMNKGNYTINAYACPVEGEGNTTDNTLTDGWIIVAMVGDVTGPEGWPDGRVDIRDLAALAKLFGKNTGDPAYNPNYDLNCDGKIDIKDIATAAKRYGQIDP